MKPHESATSSLAGATKVEGSQEESAHRDRLSSSSVDATARLIETKGDTRMDTTGLPTDNRTAPTNLRGLRRLTNDPLHLQTSRERRNEDTLQSAAELPHADPHVIAHCVRCAARSVLQMADEFPRPALLLDVEQTYRSALALLADSLNRPLPDRIRLVLANLRRESMLAVRLRQKLEEVAGPEVASAVTVTDEEAAL